MKSPKVTFYIPGLSIVLKKISKNLLFCSIFLLSIHVFAQRSNDWRSNIDNIVQRTDSLSLKSQRTFYLNKFSGLDKKYKETWYYTLSEGKVIIFQVRFVIDSTEYTESYYLNSNRPICMEQYETAYYSPIEDDMTWGEVLFFVDNTLKLYVSRGERNSSYGVWQRQSESLERFNKRFAELKRSLGLLERGIAVNR